MKHVLGFLPYVIVGAVTEIYGMELSDWGFWALLAAVAIAELTPKP